MERVILKAKQTSYIGEHICHRSCQLLRLLRWRVQRRCAICAMIVSVAADMALGCAMYEVINTYLPPAFIAEVMLYWRIEVKDFLESLLAWLMGAPAGLKLNHELSAFMGTFFVYHVHVWMGYLNVIEPYLECLIQMLTLSSCLGITVLLSAGNDVVNLLTFHMYCFYAYAAKMYGFLLTALISLARLFTGKKWNKLRMRVDSVSYEADQLVFGTILFTILLFLLPTVFLYYVVFMAMRFGVLLPQLAVHAFVYFIHTGFPRFLWPDYDIDHETRSLTLWTWLWKSDSVSAIFIAKEILQGGIVRPWWRST